MNRKNTVLRVILIVLIILLSLLLIAAVSGYIYVNSLLDLVDRTEITGDENLSEEQIYIEEPTVAETTPPEQIQQIQDNFEQIQKEPEKKILDDEGIENFLLIGSDRRSTAENGRSDAMMILSINHNTKKIHIVSLMRAIYVNIPRSKGDVWGMLNAAYSWGGPKLLIDTVERNFMIKLHHYIVVDFTSFEKAVDIVGGVPITLTAAEADRLATLQLFYSGAGTHVLNGKQALAYSRIRYIDNDFVRTSRQRKVITALLQKMTTVNIGQLQSLAEQILPLVSTDLTNGQIMGYLSQAPAMLGYDISQRMLPIENESGKTYTGKIYINGREMYKIDFAKNIEELHSFLRS